MMNKYVLILETPAQMSNENMPQIMYESGYECLVYEDLASTSSFGVIPSGAALQAERGISL